MPLLTPHPEAPVNDTRAPAGAATASEPAERATSRSDLLPANRGFIASLLSGPRERARPPGEPTLGLNPCQPRAPGSVARSEAGLPFTPVLRLCPAARPPA